MIDDRFITKTDKLIKILKRLEVANDTETEEMLFEELELDFGNWCRGLVTRLNS